MVRTTLVLTLTTILAFPAEVQATDHEPPRTVMHAPRGQLQRAGISGYEWWPRSPSDTACPQGPQPHADVFGSPKGAPIEVRAGAPLFIRFHTSRQPSSMSIRSYAAPSSVPFALEPYAPAGEVVAWDARFVAPRFRHRARNLIWADGRWTDEHCPDYTQWTTWNFVLKRRR